MVSPNILIIGATSTIAYHCAELWAREKANFFLVFREADKLSPLKNKLSALGAKKIDSYILNVLDFDQHQAMLNMAFSSLKRVDIVLIAHGQFLDPELYENNALLALQEFNINCVSTISLLLLLKQKMQAQQSGVMAVISSVAGERGRSSSYLYDAAKSALSTICSGLRASLLKDNVHVITIKPGFVNTPLTQKLSFPKLLIAQPNKVAKDIVKAIQQKKNVLYTPWFWRPFMIFIRLIPEPIFKRLKI